MKPRRRHSPSKVATPAQAKKEYAKRYNSSAFKGVMTATKASMKKKVKRGSKRK